MLILPSLMISGFSMLLFQQQVKATIHNANASFNQDIATLNTQRILELYEQQFSALYQQINNNPQRFLHTAENANSNSYFLLRYAAEQNPAINNILLIGGDNALITYPGLGKERAGFDFNEIKGLPQYKNALSAKLRPIWSLPYRSLLNNSKQISLSQPIYDTGTGELILLLAITFDQESLSKALTANTRLPEGARSLLIDNEGVVIAHTHINLLQQDINNYITNWSDGVIGQSNSFIHSNGKDEIFFFRLNYPDWFQAITIPLKHTESQTSGIVSIAIPFVAIALLAFYLQMILLANVYFKAIIGDIVALVRAIGSEQLSNENISIQELHEIYQELHDIHLELQETKHSSVIDKLTSLYNRGAFDQELQRLEREGVAYQIGMIDIDNFKKINDTYGHPTGDAVLRRVAKAGLESFPANLGAKVFRYGGEEIVVIAPNMEHSEYRQLMYLWLSKVEAMKWRESSLRVTFSGGITAALPGERGDEALKRADEALYHAKHNGKNQICEA